MKLYVRNMTDKVVASCSQTWIVQLKVLAPSETWTGGMGLAPSWSGRGGVGLGPSFSDRGCVGLVPLGAGEEAWTRLSWSGIRGVGLIPSSEDRGDLTLNLPGAWVWA